MTRAHRWALTSSTRAVCERCGAVLVVELDNTGPRIFARIRRDGAEKCPGVPPTPPAPLVCAGSTSRSWWHWSDVRQTSWVDRPSSCGVAPDDARGDHERGGDAPVAMGWATVARCDDGAPPKRSRRLSDRCVTSTRGA